MNLTIYIIEAKNRLVLILFSFILCFITSYCYKETLLFLTIKNLKISKEDSFYFISTNLTEIITSYIKLSYINSASLILILITYHILTFFGPALTAKEYNTIKQYSIKNFYFFIFLLLIFNIYLLPLFWKFFLDFQNLHSFKKVNIYFEGRIEEYINFYSKLCFLLFVSTQFCVSLFLILNKIKNKITFIKKSRKIIYLVLLLISTTITPPDVFSQLIIFFLFLIIFEILTIITIFKSYLIR